MNVRRAILVTMAIGGLAATTARTQDETKSSPLGIVDNEQFGLSEAAGATWVRAPIQWKYIEPQDGTYEFATIDAWVETLQNANMHMSPVVVIGKVWANHQVGDPWNPTDDPADIPDYPSRSPNDLTTTFNAGFGYSATYYDYVLTFVDRYAGQVDRITVENEVNTVAFGAEFWESPIEDYVKVLTTARLAAMDADPTALVFDSGMGSGSWGAPVAQDRFESGDWTATQAHQFMVDYYERDVFARPPLSAIFDPGFDPDTDLQNFFDTNPAIGPNYDVVTYVLEHLWSSDLNMMLVDGINVKFTAEPWLIGEVVAWIEEVVADAAPPEADPVLPLPVVNNEGSNWCVEYGDYNGQAENTCTLVLSDFPKLASEMTKKVVMGIETGVVQTLWFPLSNDLSQYLPTPRLGLYDYNGDATISLPTYQRVARFIGWNRQYDRTDVQGTSVQDYVFSETATGREDVHVLWWDDGTHGIGSESVTLSVPSGTVIARWYTQNGDSTDLTVTDNEVSLIVTATPSFVYFDDLFTPVTWPLDPVVGPAPPAVVLAAPAPNPSAGYTRIAFGLPDAGSRLNVGVYDLGGRLVAELVNGAFDSGAYRVTWDGRGQNGQPVGAGIYLVRLTAGTQRMSRKLVLVR